MVWRLTHPNFSGIRSCESKPHSLGIKLHAIALPCRRSQELTDKTGKVVLEDQTPAKGKYLLMKVHIPPTMDDSVGFQNAFELITAFDDVNHRLAWKNLLPQWFIKAERWQALSTTEDGKTVYESREVFGGIGAYLIKWFIATNLMKSFEAMADAVKTRSEQK